MIIEHRKEEIRQSLQRIDIQSIRAIRTNDVGRINQLEEQASTLRIELSGL